MTNDEPADTRLLGTLRSADGKGVVRMEDRFDTDVDDVWSAITEPPVSRAGSVRSRATSASAVSSTDAFSPAAPRAQDSVEACEPPGRLLVTLNPGEPDENVIEVVLVADGGGTILVWEERGLPLDKLAAYGAGIQIHVEDLAAHLDGREHCDAGARWDVLQPAYEHIAADVG